MVIKLNSLKKIAMPKAMICDTCACSIHDDYSDDYFKARETIKSLTEQVEADKIHIDELKAIEIHLQKQVEKLKVVNAQLEQSYKYIHDSRNKADQELDESSKELSRLREREKELVEALREFCQAVRKSDEKYPDWVGTTEVYGALFKSESLLSKFEVPNV